MRKSAAILIALLAAGTAPAMTTDGTLITNVASASYWSADGTKYLVSYNTTSTVLVANPAIQLYKMATPSMQCSGGTVTFCIYAVNTSANSSAFNVVVEDWVPLNSTFTDGFAFIIGSRTNWNPQSAQGVTITPGFSWFAVGPGWRTWWIGTDPDGDPDLNAGVMGQYYIKWAISIIGPGKSAMVCYKATVL